MLGWVFELMPLRGLRGLCFSGLFYNPPAPFFKGDLWGCNSAFSVFLAVNHY